MENSNKKSENNLPYEKNDNGVKNLGDCMLSWTPGNEQTPTGKVYQQGGITMSKGKQESSIKYSG